jgi:hypothetical protein
VNLRRCGGTGATTLRHLAAVSFTLAALAVAGSALAATSRGCGGKIVAGDPHGISLHASDLRVRTLNCRSARRIVLSYLRKKLSPSETCAALAENPPFSGCKVERYRCRRTAPTFKYGADPEICSWSDKSVRFLERDEDNG